MDNLVDEGYIPGFHSLIFEATILPKLLLPRPIKIEDLCNVAKIVTLISTLQSLRSVSKKWKVWVESTLEWNAWRVVCEDLKKAKEITFWQIKEQQYILWMHL